MKRSTLLLIGILAALGIVTYIVLQRPGESTSDASSPEMLVSYDSSAVDKIQISSGGSTVILALEGGKWMITAPVHFRADQSAVAAALSRGRKIEVRGLVSNNPEKQGIFQVDSAGTLVQVFERGTEKAAFRIGKPGTSDNETYIRREGATEVLVGEGPLAYLYVKSPNDWRDRTVFRADRDRITSVRYRYGDTTFTLSFTDSVWQVDSRPASPAAVQSLLSTLSNYLANDFLDSSFTPPGPPAATVEVLDAQIRFYPMHGSGRFLVQSSRDPQWYVAEPYRAQDLLKRKRDLIAP
jgi:hypothetical protein